MAKDRRRDLRNPDELSPKVIQAGETWGGQPYIAVTGDNIVIAAELNKGIILDPDYGTIIQGPLSLSEMPENVSFGGGFWRVNPAVLGCIGSSAAMNIPWLVPSEPELVQQRFDLADIDAGMGIL